MRVTRWVRIRVKSLWLALRVWKTTREIRTLNRLVTEHHRRNVEALRSTR